MRTVASNWIKGRQSEIRQNVSLAHMTTAKTGGNVEKLHVPHLGDDLTMLPKESGDTYRILSGGSNMLITDLRKLSDVISMREYDTTIDKLGLGYYRVGASVRIQRLIKTINADGFGGIEELISLPALVGGMIAMNASAPGVTCISDYLVSVIVFDGNKIIELSKDECDFGYRDSIFLTGKFIVLSGLFAFPRQDQAKSAKRIKDRITLTKIRQDTSYPNFGSVFSVSSETIMRLVRKVGMGSGSSKFSKKTNNWLLCGGSFSESLAAIKRVEFLHKLMRKECVREVIIWE